MPLLLLSCRGMASEPELGTVAFEAEQDILTKSVESLHDGDRGAVSGSALARLPFARQFFRPADGAEPDKHGTKHAQTYRGCETLIVGVILEGQAAGEEAFREPDSACMRNPIDLRPRCFFRLATWRVGAGAASTRMK